VTAREACRVLTPLPNRCGRTRSHCPTSPLPLFFTSSKQHIPTDTMEKTQDTHRQPYSWHQVGTTTTTTAIGGGVTLPRLTRLSQSHDQVKLSGKPHGCRSSLLCRCIMVYRRRCCSSFRTRHLRRTWWYVPALCNTYVVPLCLIPNLHRYRW
jgi:hypothetical protein